MTDDIFNIIEHTRRSVFLTGKAGTGKTTFLNTFTKKTSKKYVVAAPTGIAAINAGGVTLHSLFGLPLTNFLPTLDEVDRNEAINIPQLIPHFKYRKEKLKLFQAIEILIIDEVSMLRVDVLDMVDLALRSARRSTIAFGGVQLLLIGDLYQLPPVVKQASEKLLNRYYASPYFFDATALKQTPLLTITLTTIYRQSDPRFIALLNAIRQGAKEAIDFDFLNTRYQPGFEPQDEYVYLVSHNHMADAINNRQLKMLNEKGKICHAIIEGDFKEHLYPNDPDLLLKPGAQVMFIRNDTAEEKKYFNGRLAKVIAIQNDHITVLPDGSSKELQIERETWEHKKYYLNEKKEIKEDVVGSYEQFPFRLAWAVTIHKSQGLTFDKVVIDAGQSFTNGQVYVALSRCRSFEGVVLKSKISHNVIFQDHKIEAFQDATHANEKIEAIYAAEKNDFALSKLINALNSNLLKPALEDLAKAGAMSMYLDGEAAASFSSGILQTIDALYAVYSKFTNFLHSKAQNSVSNWALIEEKSIGAVNYFYEQVFEKIFEPLKNQYTRTKGLKGLKGYSALIKTLLDDCEDYLHTLKGLHLLGTPLFTKKDAEPIDTSTIKKPSHIISYEMMEEGLSAKEIEEKRGLTASTIYGHFAKMAEVGVLDIHKLFNASQLEQFETLYKTGLQNSLSDYKIQLPEFEFYELRVLFKHFHYWNTRKKVTPDEPQDRKN